MRWFWVDRFIEFKSGSHAKAIKNVTLAEEHLHDHQPGFPVMPASLILEGLAQTGGLLLGEQRQFSRMVILAKVPRMTFHGWARPGDTLTYSAKLIDSRDEGGMVEVQARVGDRLVADGEIVFAHVDSGTIGAGNADQMNCVFALLRGVLEDDAVNVGSSTAVMLQE
jgi:3-hydroxyacyl-[acyl-carrier-protein] dehydratase